MGNETTVAANGAAAMTLYKLEAQEFLQSNLVISKLGTNTSIGTGQGQTISEWRPAKLAAVTTPFSEGVGPAAATVLTGTTYTATLAQVGAYAKPTDVFQFTGRDPKLAQYMKVFKYQAKLSMDTLAYNLLTANATAFYAGGETSTTFSGTALLSGKELRRLRRKLARKDVPTFNNGLYALVIHPDQTMDLFDEDKSGSITDIYRPENGDKLMTANARRLWGFEIDESTVITTTTINNNTAYQAIACGAGAFINVDSSAIPMEFYYVSPKVVNQANPVGTQGVLGWKSTYAELWVGDDGPRALTVNTGAGETD